MSIQKTIDKIDEGSRVEYKDATKVLREFGFVPRFKNSKKENGVWTHPLGFKIDLMRKEHQLHMHQVLALRKLIWEIRRAGVLR